MLKFLVINPITRPESQQRLKAKAKNQKFRKIKPKANASSFIPFFSVPNYNIELRLIFIPRRPIFTMTIIRNVSFLFLYF